MAPSIIEQLDGNDAIQGEVFLPGQIFVFGGFILRANLLGHLEQIESYAPGHQVRFGNLNYTADICEDLTFNGFGPAPGAPDSHDEHGLDLLSDNAICPEFRSGLLQARYPEYCPTAGLSRAHRDCSALLA